MRKKLVVGVWLLVSGLVAACQQPQPQPPSQPAGGAAPAGAVSGVNDRLILAAAEIALPPPGVSPGDLPSPADEGAQLLATYCVTCHNLPSPTIHSATDWPGVVRRMWLRMDLLPAELGVKVPTIQQRQAMLNYLVANALRVSGANLPEGVGRSTFSEKCSRCHALPDPRQHSAADWPAVVMRMEERMTQMKVSRPSPPQTQEIIQYLSRVSSTKK